MRKYIKEDTEIKFIFREGKTTPEYTTFDDYEIEKQEIPKNLKSIDQLIQEFDKRWEEDEKTSKKNKNVVLYRGRWR